MAVTAGGARLGSHVSTANAGSCSVEDCASPAYCRGLCNRHYYRQHRYGSPDGGPSTPVGDGSIEVLADLSCSYRQLDYWLRVGTITCAADAQGSGSRRRFTPAERAAIADVAREVAALAERDRHVRSGAYFAERLAVHEQAPTRTTS